MCYSCVIYVLFQVYERVKGEDVMLDVHVLYMCYICVIHVLFMCYYRCMRG